MLSWYFEGLRLFQWQGWTGLLACMIAEGPHIVLMKLRDIASECLSYIAILQIRIYALYSLNNKLLAVMLFFYFTCSACSAWIVINELSSISSMDSPTSSFFFTSQSDYVFFFVTSNSADPPSRWRFLLIPPSSSWNFQILDSHAVVWMSSLRSGTHPRILEV